MNQSTENNTRIYSPIMQAGHNLWHEIEGIKNDHKIENIIHNDSFKIIENNIAFYYTLEKKNKTPQMKTCIDQVLDKLPLIENYCSHKPDIITAIKKLKELLIIKSNELNSLISNDKANEPTKLNDLKAK